MGTRQGCNLSPLVFNLFINDLVSLFKKFTCNPVSMNNQELSILLYADDIVLLSEKASGLQRAINLFQEYCRKWKLKVNLKKTKIIIFNSSIKSNCKYKFYFDNNIVEIVNRYCYLGIIFTNNCSFKQCSENLQAKASKAYYALINSIKIDHCKNIKLLSKLYNALILPIILYGSEIWAISNINKRILQNDNWPNKVLSNNKFFNKLHLKFCRYLLQVNRFSEKNSLMAELGRHPTIIYSITNFVKYFFRLSQFPDKVLLSKACNVSKSIDSGLVSVYEKLINILPIDLNLLNAETKLNTKMKKLACITKSYLKNIYNDACMNTIQTNNGKLEMYKLVKKNVCTEKYLLVNLNTEDRRSIARIRLSSHKLPIEIGRKQGIDRVNRFCKLCETGEIGSEFHVCMACPNPALIKHRSDFLINIGQLIYQFKDLDSTSQWLIIMNCTDYEVIKIFGKFITLVLNTHNKLNESLQTH